jgi:deazaflavin-dependent oxidoreductase (nitroreductase family)
MSVMNTTAPVVIPPRGTRGVSFPRLPMWLMRFVNDRMFSFYRNRSFRGGQVLSLHTIGARSGEPRRSTVAYLSDGDRAWLVVASGGGTANHPAWFFNLAGHPDDVAVEIGHQRFKVKARTLEAQERADALNRITSAMPTFKDYEIKTDREIPVVRLSAV